MDRATGNGESVPLDRSCLITPLSLCSADTTGKETQGLPKWAGDNSQATFQNPCLQPCREQEGHQRLQTQGDCPKPPQTAESQAPLQAWDCCWLQPFCWKQKQKGGENLYPGLAGRM